MARTISADQNSCWPDVTPATCCIDEFGPLPLGQPATVAELADLVRGAAARGQAVYPVGGRTMLGYGNVPTQPGVAIDLRRLDQVIDYPARDMTITVQAGITVAQLQSILAAENQRLPIDVPLADQATLGGVIATNMSGARRYGFGTLRDYVIGISVVNDEGQEVKAGGRVVKNVAGYDLCKLYVGSLGTLGIITQVTLKLRPRPEETALITIPLADGEIETGLNQLHASRTRPVCLELLNTAAARRIGYQTDAPWRLVVGYEDNRDALNWQVQQLVREFRAGCALDARVGFPAEPLWRGLVELPAWPEAGLTFKANLLPSAVASFGLRAAQLSEPLVLEAHAGNGIVVGHAGAALSLERAVKLIHSLRELAAAGKGQVIVLRCPAAWKKTLSVWGPPRGDAALMRQVKDKLDPRRLFNPGRFADSM